MNDDEARSWLAENGVPRETFSRLEAFAALVLAANQTQNLISRSTEDAIWSRHIVDSAQLVTLVDHSGAPWLDIGAGAGFPGIVIALMTGAPTILVEPRRLRVAFLEQAVVQLGLTGQVTVIGARVETVQPAIAPVNITARAYAPLEQIFTVSERIAGPQAVYVLPKGRSTSVELESVKRTWQGVFHVERSVTDRDAAIIVARAVQRRNAR